MKQLILMLCCCLCLAACVKWDITGPAGPAGPQGPPGQKPPGTDTGTIWGRVYTVNELTFPIAPVDSVKITLQVSTDSTLTTMADPAGYYYFHNVSTGTYNLIYSRPGFGEMKKFGLTHLSGGKQDSRAPDVLLLQIPELTVVDTAWFQRTMNGDLSLQFELRIPYPPYQPIPENFDFYFSKHPDVTVSNYLFRMDGASYIPKATLDKYFATGDSMYCRIYTVDRYFIADTLLGIYSNGYAWQQMKQPVYYIDPATGLSIYPARSRESALIKTVY